VVLSLAAADMLEALRCAHGGLGTVGGGEACDGRGLGGGWWFCCGCGWLFMVIVP
jgi:hypothetical protein